MRSRKLVTIDCETDPFLRDRVPVPFIWGAYDGKDFITFDNGKELLEYFKNKNVYLYAHNGGKFDFMFLLEHMEETRVLIINSRIVQMKFGKALLRDSFSILQCKLADFQKTEIEYWKLEKDCRNDHMEEIINYLRDDCMYLHILVSAFFSAAGKRPTIAGNALHFAKSNLKIEISKTHHRFDNLFREFYFGGRVEVFKKGIHRNLNIYDIKSSYPNAMMHEMPHGDEYIIASHIDGYDEKTIQQAFIDLTCVSDCAFPLVVNNTLTFPHILGRFKVTGWEYLVALKHKLISHVRINDIYILSESINLKSYVDHWYDHKAKAEERGDKPDRIVAKFMLNSLYGKFAQNPIHYFDYKIYPANTKVDHENGWQLDASFANKEIHARPTLWTYKKKYGDDWVKFPMYYNVATGASITGFARAALLDAIHTVGVENLVYCDTDSIFVNTNAPSHLLRQDNKIGAWEWEGLADPVYMAGKKLYGLTFVNGPKTGEIKLAHKGARLTLNEIRRITLGETITWQNDAPTFSLGRDPRFLSRQIKRTS